MQELFLSWWTFGALGVLVLFGLWLLFRSFRKWQQPRPGRDALAQDAELDLQVMSKRTRGGGGPF